ncbi:MAG: sigma 54-interacting transcriptional regulator, partial [Candidatus Sumerlaeota bacterium]
MANYSEEIDKEKSNDVQTLRLLFEISQILDSSMDLREVVQPVLSAISKNMNLMRGTITLLNPVTKEQEIEAAYGLSEAQKKRGIYKQGEGVIGQVVETGKPLAIPKISESSLFLNRTGARKANRTQDSSFLCVPIKLDKEVIGTFSADSEVRQDHDLEEDLRVLTIVASMIAQAVNLRRIAREEQQRLMEENNRLQSELKDRYRPERMIGNSNEIQHVCNLIDQVSKSNATVMIRGESGTGKELVASSIHYHSLRCTKPYVKVNCAALPESLIESELFGHERGAFTGAVSMRKGRFELAAGGTIFLDEIGYLAPPTQAKLLRAIEQGEVQRI